MSTARKITPECQPVFPCWLWLPKVWNGKEWAPGWEHTTTAQGGFHYDSRATHWHPDQPTAPTVTPCLAPRQDAGNLGQYVPDASIFEEGQRIAKEVPRPPAPSAPYAGSGYGSGSCGPEVGRERVGSPVPAPRDAEWAKRAWRELNAELNDGMTSERAASIILRHASADSASAQLAAMREHHNWTLESDSIVASCGCMTKTNEVKYHKPGCKYRLICERDESRTQLASAQAEVGRLTGEATCHFMDIEAAIGKGRLLGGWSTAASEIATLRRERDEAQSAYRARDNDPGQPHGT